MPGAFSIVLAWEIWTAGLALPIWVWGSGLGGKLLVVRCVWSQRFLGSEFAWKFVQVSIVI